jgi:aminodeoxyfutalosine deaminase
MPDPRLDIDSFIAGLPKVELHVHLVGSASVPTVIELARRHPDCGVPTVADELRRFYEFTDFAHFIRVYIAVNALIRTPDDLTALTYGTARDLASQNVRYAEITVTPDSHLLMGIKPEAIGPALTEARNQARTDFGIELGWIFDIPGELGLESGERTVDWVERFAPEGSVGFGLGGPELGVPRSQFADVFGRARALGLASVPHAGETTGPETIWESIRLLGARRIGHGITALRDPDLVSYLAAHDVTLDMSPTSNLRTRAVTTLAEHPLPALLRSGVGVTLNSDDPGMFATTLNGEFGVAHHDFGMDAGQLADLARTAARASFCAEHLRRRILADIDAYTAGAEV